MLESSRIWGGAAQGLGAALAAAAIGLAGCAFLEPKQQVPPLGSSTDAVAIPPKADPVTSSANQDADRGPSAYLPALREQARALLSHAETDIQRARTRRALWSKAWEALVGARAGLAANDIPESIRLANRASELAQLGLEQLAYPAVK